MIFSIVTLISLLTDAAIGADVVWSVPHQGLALGGQVNDTVVAVHLQNVSSQTVSVWSHVLSVSGEEHLDWFSMMLTSHDDKRRVVRFLDARDKTAPVVVMLAPGAIVRHTVDVVEWLNRPMNGGGVPAAGTYDLSVTYEVGVPGGWNGRLVSPTLSFGLPDESGVVPPTPAKNEYVLEGDLF